MVLNLYVWFIGYTYDGNYVSIVANSLQEARYRLLKKDKVMIDGKEEFNLNDKIYKKNEEGKDVKSTRSWKTIIEDDKPEIYGPLENGYVFGLSHYAD